MTNKKSDDQTTAWQVIALSSEIDQQRPLARHQLADEYVLFRNQDNKVCALEDRCVHRRAPLSLGRITDQGTIQCPYHGWTYEGEHGLCVQIPNLSDSEKTPSYQTRSFNTREEHGLVYLWQGESPPENSSSLTRVSLDSQSASGEGRTLLTLSYQNMIDTLLDSPSLLLKIDEVSIIDDHWMGEPNLDGSLFTVERAADWSKKAKRRKRIASDLPLVVRIQLDTQFGIASIELIDDNNGTLVKAVIGLQPVTTAVTALLWRWEKQGVNAKNMDSKDHATAQKLSFSVAEELDASRLVAVKPYVSSILHGQIEPASSLDRH